MTREFLKNIKNENRLDKIRLIMKNDDVIGGQPKDDESFTSNTPFLDIACTMKFTIDAASTADDKAVAAQNTADAAKTAAANADKKAAGAQTAAATADGKAVAAQKTADEAKTAAENADKKAAGAQTAATTADSKAVAAQKTADEAKTAAANADKKVKPITEGGTGATTAAAARTNLGLKSAATLDKTDNFGTSANLVATQLLVDKLQKEMFDAMPVGVIVSWDHAEAPKNWLFVRDQKFSATEYPELAKLYPKLVLNDRRGTVDRALDAGRGFDSGRALGSYQEDAMQKLTGEFVSRAPRGTTLISGATGVFSTVNEKYNSSQVVISPDKGDGDLVGFDSSRVARTANETRMKNVATNKIIKAR